MKTLQLLLLTIFLPFLAQAQCLQNPDFETGSLVYWAPWLPSGTVAAVNNNQRSGDFAVQLQGGEVSIEQVISDLLPNTTYTFSAWGKVVNTSQFLTIGVKNYGGGQLTAAFTSTSYVQQTISFTTGSTNTSAKVFFYADPSTTVGGYGDDFELSGDGCEPKVVLPLGTYYVDAIVGNDLNDGSSPTTAWQSMTNVNSSIFTPGSTVRLHCGDTWNEALKPTCSGALGQPLSIDMYGDCFNKEDKPHIAANGAFQIGVHLYNVEYWEVNNLQISNDSPDGTEYTGAKGILLELNNFGTGHHLWVRNCYIHDIDGNNKKGSSGANGLREGDGIKWKNDGALISVFDSLRIENNYLEKVDRNGIKGSGYFARDNWHPSTNVYIGHNELYDIGGDGIVVIATDGALVEHNILREFKMRPPPERDCSAGIWSWSADNTIFQYNEAAYGNATIGDGCDAQGFDADANCINTIFQYNYSHDNDGGFMLIINYEDGTPENAKMQEVIVRYNISQNDGALMKRLIQMTGAYDECYIYNNVFYLGEGTDIDIFDMGAWPDGFPLNNYFYNNIFYLDNAASAIYDATGMGNYTFSNNIFYGNHQNLSTIIPTPVTSDPLLVNVGSGGDGMNALDGYQLLANSPAIDMGMAIPSFTGLDFWANPVPQNGSIDIGVHEFSQISLNATVLLEGAYETGNSLMRTDLKQANLLPTLEPYSAMGWHSNNEETSPAVLANFPVVDWVLVELRDKSDGTTVVETKAALLLENGQLKDLNGIDALKFNAPIAAYYVVLRHRNHLAVMTATPVFLAANTSLDFRNVSLYGGPSAAADIGGLQALRFGDLTFDGIIDAADRSAAWNNRNEIGYLFSDVNMDGVCDAEDRSGAWNQRNFGSLVP